MAIAGSNQFCGVPAPLFIVNTKHPCKQNRNRQCYENQMSDKSFLGKALVYGGR